MAQKRKTRHDYPCWLSDAASHSSTGFTLQESRAGGFIGVLKKPEPSIQREPWIELKGK